MLGFSQTLELHLGQRNGLDGLSAMQNTYTGGAGVARRAVESVAIEETGGGGASGTEEA